MAIILTLLLLEAVLSFDNAAILAAMVRRLPVSQRRKALTYGLVGAYALRFSAIALAAWLIKNPWLKLAGGGYLVYIGVKHFIHLARGTDDHQTVSADRSIWARMGVPVFWATIIQIELLDLAFAIDQVVVAVAFTPNIWLIIVASGLGILFLRLAAVYLARVMDWLPVLEHMAYIAVGYVGVKLIVQYEWFNDGHGYHIPTPLSLAITLALFGVPVILRLFGILKPSDRNGHASMLADPTTPRTKT